MEWLKSIVREAVKEAVKDEKVQEAIEDARTFFNETDITPEQADELARGIGDLYHPEHDGGPTPLNVPINLFLDGKTPEPITDEGARKIVELALNETLKQEIERYLGEQFKSNIGLSERERDIVDGKIIGVIEFFTGLRAFEFEAREGVEQETIDEESSAVE